MLARYAGASLGLLAFAVSTVAGLLAQNSVGVILSRSIFALFVFCIIGLVLGGVARMIIAEHETKQALEIRKRYEEADVDQVGAGAAAEPDSASPARTLDGGEATAA